MNFGVSKPVRRLLLLLVFGVAPVVIYLGYLRPSTRAEYFLQENLRALEVLGEQLGAIWGGYLSSIKFAGERGVFGHLKGALSPPRPPQRSIGSREDGLDCGGRPADCSAVLRIVERPLGLPMSSKLQHTFDAADTSGVTEQSSDLVVSASCKCSGTGREPVETTLTVSLDKLIGSLLRNSELTQHELFLANSAGAVRFEYGSTGTRLLQFGDETGEGPKKSTETEKAPAGKVGVPKLQAVRLSERTGQTMVTEVEAMGRRFQLLTLPFEVSARLDASSDSTVPPETWILGLLVSSDQLAQKARTFSYGSWSAVPLLLLVALFSIPILKIRSIGPREAFSQRDVRWLAASLVAVPTVLATVLVALFSYTAREQLMDHQLQDISKQMQRNFADEIAVASTALDDFIEHRARPRASSMPNGDPGPAFECVVDQSTKGNGCSGTEFGLQNLLNTYPFFDFVLWTDRNGRQWEKWSVEKKATPLINMRDFHPYFQALVEQRVDKTIHTQVSPLTGQSITVLSKPFGNGSAALGIAALVWSPLSVVGAVVPPGIGYAVVEDHGRVVFHHVSRRSLYENFLEETDRSAAISSLIQGGRHGIVQSHYHGRSHRLYVHPLGTMPWSLIVFRDKEILRAADLDIMLTWCAGILLIAVTWVLVRVLVRLVFGRASVLWYWPEAQAGHVYTQLCVLLGLWLVAMAWLLFSPVEVPLLMLATVVAAAPLLTSVVFLRLTRVRRQEDRDALRHRRWLAGLIFVAAMATFIASAFAGLSGSFPNPNAGRAAGLVIIVLVSLTSLSLMPQLDRLGRERVGTWRRSYVAAGVLLIIVSAVLPSLILYRDAFDSGMTVFVRHSQLKLAQRLASRADALLQRYRDRGNIKVDNTSLLDSRSQLEAEWRWANAAQGLFWDGTLKRNDGSPSDCGQRLTDGADSIPFWPNEWLGCSLAGDGGLTDLHFSAPLLACMPVYSPETVELRSLVYAEATRPRDDPCGELPWRSSIDSGRSVLTVSDRRFSDKGNRVAVRTVTSGQAIPTVPTPAGFLGWSLFAVAMLSLGGLLIATVTPIARQLFGFNFELAAHATSATSAEPPDRIWSSRSDEEKAILYNLATTGLVTPHPRAWRVVKGLVENGLLRLEPEPRFANEELREVAANTSTKAEIQTWQTGGEGNWDTIRSIAQAAAILVGVGLYFTQAEALSQWSGALTAATGLAGSLMTALGAFRAADKSKPTTS